MAETAAILSPQKKVVLPEKGAWCPMAHMITPDQLRDLKAAQSAGGGGLLMSTPPPRSKAESDVCCTSANGVQVVNSLSEKEVIFVPDRNLAAYVARHTDKKIIPWNGYCYVHDHFTARGGAVRPGRDIRRLRCWCIRSAGRRSSIRPITSTAQPEWAGMLRPARLREFIIGTEVGMIYRLKKENPDEGVLSSEQECHLPEYEEDRPGEGAAGAADPGAAGHGARGDRLAKARRSIERMLAVKS
ncbi:MAG: quinolinate synthase NadA [Comamonadaceae bacterium]|nr:quinolinate synthase NadA [Comamonadaceae bacterium]